MGERLRAGIEALRHPLVEGVRGRGLLLGIGLTSAVSKDVHAAAMDAGFIVNPVTPDTVRLAPPLILTPAQADEFLAALPAILSR